MTLSLRAKLLARLERRFPPLAETPVHSGDHARWEFAKAAGSYACFVDDLGGLAGKTVLDFGCGWGGESAWLAQRAEHVWGCDINTQALADAKRFKKEAAIANVDFTACGETMLPFEDETFDAVFSTNVFEHVMQPTAMLLEIKRVLKPGGSFVSTFGPLFYSPLGYHLSWATQVPWAHLIFGLGPVIEVRNTKRGPIHPDNWRDTGLNMMTFKQFRHAVRDAGLEVARLERIPVRAQHWLAAMPLIGDYFTFGVDCHLKRPAETGEQTLPLAAAA